jgi:hypothetical protein
MGLHRGETAVVHKENHSVDTVEFIDYVDYADYRSDVSDLNLDGPTVQSIAAALAAQKRERAAFTRDTGARLNRDGRLLHTSRSLES